MRRIRGLVPLLLSASLAGTSACLYGFAGGGLPAGIRTVAVLPFENLTAEPTLTQEITQAVREAVQNRLGLRPAGEDQADAIVRGTVTRYEPDLPLSFTGADNNRVEVTRRMVQITVSVEIINQREGKPLWTRQGLTVQGEYDTNREAEGRRRALDKLITDIVDGAQSQW
ncbi:MAG: LPS assembly lipoprotein LptE [Gemmatimonadales bacterium]